LSPMRPARLTQIYLTQLDSLRRRLPGQVRSYRPAQIGRRGLVPDEASPDNPNLPDPAIAYADACPDKSGPTGLRKPVGGDLSPRGPPG
jgi:hypothetical protein